eukprot:TRINITY_DN49711_c0_g1_i1.p1 TRINITY_DN49711_c0_g1~~TRINITY_DN49711_c0_g1_i1.p1  ORF type:complete len:367 (+),score=66.53 TRINITY_DN49711_c0_g1_i1:132-1232(+)
MTTNFHKGKPTLQGERSNSNAMPLGDKVERLWELMGSIHEELKEKLDKIERYEAHIDHIKAMQETGSTEDESSRLVLNVGGTIYETQRSVLTGERGSDSMLFAMGAGWFNNKEEGEDQIFIDRDGTLFGPILDYLRDGSVPWLWDKDTEAQNGNEVVAADTLLMARTAKLCDLTVGDERRAVMRDELNALKTEAQYYGLDTLSAIVTAALNANDKAITACELGPGSNVYSHVGPRRLCTKDTSNRWVVTISHVVLCGMKSTIEMQFLNTRDFEVHFYDADNTYLAVWTNAKADPDGMNTVLIEIDWSQKITANRYALRVSVKLNGEIWEGKDKLQGWKSNNNTKRFIAPYFGTFEEGSEMALINIW